MEEQPLSTEAKFGFIIGAVSFGYGIKVGIFDGGVEALGWQIVLILATVEGLMAGGITYLATMMFLGMVDKWWDYHRFSELTEAAEKLRKEVQEAKQLLASLSDASASFSAPAPAQSGNADLLWRRKWDEHTNQFRLVNNAKLRVVEFPPLMLKEFFMLCQKGEWKERRINKTSVSDALPSFNRVTHGEQIDAFLKWLQHYHIVAHGALTELGYESFANPQLTSPTPVSAD